MKYKIILPAIAFIKKIFNLNKGSNNLSHSFNSSSCSHNRSLEIFNLNLISKGINMAKYLIEVRHEAEKNACLRAAQILLKSGSHFLTNADFGCLDGEHMAWIIVEVNSKEEAQAILPTEYRSSAKIIKLNKFNLVEIDKLLSHHKEEN